MFLNEEQDWKAKVTICVKPSPIETVSNAEHAQNALYPIEVTMPLISTESNNVHWENARSGIESTPYSITTCFVIYLHSFVALKSNSLELEINLRVLELLMFS